MIRKVVKFKANKQHLKRITNLIYTPSGCINVFSCEFELGEPWQEYDRIYASWNQGDKTVFTDLDDSFSCVVPAEILSSEGIVNVNLIGVKDGEKRITTYPEIAINVAANVNV